MEKKTNIILIFLVILIVISFISASRYKNSYSFSLNTPISGKALSEESNGNFGYCHKLVLSPDALYGCDSLNPPEGWDGTYNWATCCGYTELCLYYTCLELSNRAELYCSLEEAYCGTSTDPEYP